MKLIINCETGEIIERELNKEELAQQTKDEAEVIKAKAEAQAKAEARAALLERLKQNSF
jgi:hypothetical protein